MTPDAAIISLNSAKKFFDTSTSCFTEEDSGFTPQEGCFTVAQQVAHVAQTIDWFVDGVFGGKGFDENFAEHEARVRKTNSLTEARAWWDRAMQGALDAWGTRSAEELAQPIENDNIMGGAPKGAALNGITDHTAHHRGALTVYARLLGKEATMPYM